MKEPRTALLGGLTTVVGEEKHSQATRNSFIASLSLPVSIQSFEKII